MFNRVSFGSLAVFAALTISHGITSVPAALGQCDHIELFAEDGAIADRFGCAVAISGTVAIVGARDDDDYGDESGSAYVYRVEGNEWTQGTKLLPADGAPDDHFGYSVAISGNLAVVGARDDDNETGSVYVFRFDGTNWTQEAKLTADDGAPEDLFGHSVAISGDTILVGAIKDDDMGEVSGSVYVYRHDGSGWNLEAKLLASDGMVGARFGYSVAIDGDVAVIGARNDDIGTLSGAAYVFLRFGTYWIEHTKLVPDDHAASRWYGDAVAIEDNVAVIGAWGDDHFGTRSGSAYVFRMTDWDWVQEAKLLAADGVAYAYFGEAVAISSDTVVVGAFRDDDLGEQSGSAYVFRFDGASWSEQSKLRAFDGKADELFADSVAVAGDVVFTGASASDDVADAAGSVYVHSLDGSDCNGNGVPDYCDLDDGTSQDCNENGVPDECDIAYGPAEDCNGNGIPDECDLRDGTSEDCNLNSIPDECDIATALSEDCNENGVPDECDIADGTSRDVNGNGIPDECEPDCNGNEIPDDWDISTGTSQDCNENGIPDECDIADRTSRDCNQTGIPDECEIADGTSEDCNANEIPDECDVLDFFRETSPRLAPFDPGEPQEYEFETPPVTAGDVTLRFEVVGDFGETSQWTDVDYRGTATTRRFAGSILQHGANACPGSPDLVELAIPMDAFNDVAGDGRNVTIYMTPVQCVGRDCTNSYIRVTLDYPIAEGDCNDNAIPDECDIADGTSTDVNDNGVPDECDPDCNENGVPDDLDIADGTSADINGNGVPDECDPDCNDNGVPDDWDILSGSSADCNENDVPDECDLRDGTSDDCNGNEIPDDCELAEYVDVVAESPRLSPIGYLSPQSFTLARPPNAVGDVTLTFETIADLGGDSRVIGIRINDVPFDWVFREVGHSCPDEADVDQLTIPAAAFNAAVAGGDAVIQMVPNRDVDAALCDPPSYIIATVEYLAYTEAPDCNGNGILDGCEIADGSVEDCNANGVPDECELIESFWHSSPKLAPIGGDAPQHYTLNDPPVALSDVQVTLRTVGNFAWCGAWIDFYFEHDWIGSAFEMAHSCALPPDVVQFSIPMDDYNAAIADREVRFDLIPTPDTDSGSCYPTTWAMIWVEYVCASPDDCNGNGIPDDCDIADGTSFDVNQNGVPDECECPGDLDHDWDIDLADLAQLLPHYGTTSGASYTDGDLDLDGDVDLADLSALLSVYGDTCD